MKNKELINLSAIEIYNLLLTGNIKSFPRYFWDRPEAFDNSIKIVKYLLEEKLNWDKEDIKDNISQKFFGKYKLSGMIQTLYSGSPYKLINAVYPKQFKEWELNVVPNGFWTIDKGIEATKWLIEDVLRWDNEDIKQKINKDIFTKYKLDGMVQSVFEGSPVKAIILTYPNIKPWELQMGVYPSYWTEETIRDAIKWLIEEKLQWNNEQIIQNINNKIFVDNGLFYIIGRAFKNSYEALKYAYPNEDWSTLKLRIGKYKKKRNC